MPDTALTEMDLALLTSLLESRAVSEPGILPHALESSVKRAFPGYDEVTMREGESVTRLRGRQLIAVHMSGGLYLTELGRQLAEGLRMEETS